jgi:hypothetical protein
MFCDRAAITFSSLRGNEKACCPRGGDGHLRTAGYRVRPGLPSLHALQDIPNYALSERETARLALLPWRQFHQSGGKV